MQDNMMFYNQFRAVPDEAKKPISGGRLAGMTDINPMWRIKMLTEQFGPCGTGWKYQDVNMQLCPGANGEIALFVTLNLYYKVDGEWSEPIPGVGGSTFVAKERSGPYTDDEAYKKALTDALSVACKALGMGADVYFARDSTKYTKPAAAPVVNAADEAEKAALIGLIVRAIGQGEKYANAVSMKRYNRPLSALALNELDDIWKKVRPKDENTGLPTVSAIQA